MLSKSKITDSTYNLNIPDVQKFAGKFVYNFYLQDERVNSRLDQFSTFSPDASPRYVALTWDRLEQKTIISGEYEFTEPVYTPQVEVSPTDFISEDDDLSPAFISQDFSDITSIQQGTADLKNYSVLFQTNIDSLHKQQKQIIDILIKSGGLKSNFSKAVIEQISQAYDVLSDVPIESMGLRVYDQQDNPTDDDTFLKTAASSLTLSLKINKLVIPDIFSTTEETVTGASTVTEKFYTSAKSLQKTLANNSFVPAIEAPVDFDNLAFSTPRALGYVVKRYVKSNNSLKEEFSIFLNDPSISSYIDKDVVYGKTYVYTINAVVQIDLLGLDEDQNSVAFTLNALSRASSTAVGCYEFVPPPPPADIKFEYDYLKKNVVMFWDFPVNPQRDIKQFQVFRRKSIQEPFELIAQYGFDNSLPDTDNQKFVTGEVVDVNNVENMNIDYKYLAIQAPGPTYRHVDRDFIVDTEFFETTSYIYSLASVDAHGMVSNYSAQYLVKFDPFKNKLIISLVCDEGAPRAYPNMTLKVDAFKDSIRVQGDYTKELQVYFTPEYLNVQDERGNIFKVVQAQVDPDSPNEALFIPNKPFYLMQIVNLDNQKTQTLKINIKDLPIPYDALQAQQLPT